MTLRGLADGYDANLNANRDNLHWQCGLGLVTSTQIIE